MATEEGALSRRNSEKEEETPLHAEAISPEQSESAASSPWYFFGWGGPSSAKAEEAEAPSPTAEQDEGKEDEEKEDEEKEEAGEKEEGVGAGVRTVRFDEAATTSQQSRRAERARKKASVLNLGFVDLVETLLLNHDAEGRGLRKALSSSSSLNTETLSESDSLASLESRADSSFDGRHRPSYFQRGEDDDLDAAPLWLLEAEGLNALLQRVHERFREQLDEEALFLDAKIREASRRVRADLHAEETESAKILCLEALRFGEGRSLLDSSDDEELDDAEAQSASKARRLRKVDLVNLMALTGRSLEQWKKTQFELRVSACASTGRTARGLLTERRLRHAASGGATLRSPLFQVHQQLERLASTSSSSEASDSETKSLATSASPSPRPGLKEDALAQSASPASKRIQPRVPRLPLNLSSPATAPSPTSPPPVAAAQTEDEKEDHRENQEEITSPVLAVPRTQGEADVPSSEMMKTDRNSQRKTVAEETILSPLSAEAL